MNKLVDIMVVMVVVMMMMFMMMMVLVLLSDRGTPHPLCLLHDLVLHHRQRLQGVVSPRSPPVLTPAHRRCLRRRRRNHLCGDDLHRRFCREAVLFGAVVTERCLGTGSNGLHWSGRLHPFQSRPGRLQQLHMIVFVVPLSILVLCEQFLIHLQGLLLESVHLRIASLCPTMMGAWFQVSMAHLVWTASWGT